MSDESKEPQVIDAELVEDTTAVEVAAPVTPAFDYTDAGVPTFDYVRDRIEGRIGTSVGEAELVGESTEAAAIDKQFADREQAGLDKLEEIRRSMRGE